MVPVTAVCPDPPVVAAVTPSAQSVLASAQTDLPVTTIPPCGPCATKHPLLGKIFHRY
jgi:hypothetical protein